MKTPTYWTMKNGQKINVDLMDINHLRNVLKMIIRNNEKVQTTKEFKLNGDMAQEFNNSYPEDEEDIDHHEFESDLGPRFNDDEARGNQW